MARRTKTTMAIVAVTAAGAAAFWWFWPEIRKRVVKPVRTWVTSESKVKLDPGVALPSPKKIYTPQELEYYGEMVRKNPAYALQLPEDLRKLL
jgi:hypothetical protein